MGSTNISLRDDIFDYLHSIKLLMMEASNKNVSYTEVVEKLINNTEIIIQNP